MTLILMGAWCRSNKDLNLNRLKRRVQKREVIRPCWNDRLPSKKTIFYCDGEVFFLDRGLLMGAIC
jgi:hypothetical protein